MRSLEKDDRVWVLTDDGDIHKGIIVHVTGETYLRMETFRQVRVYMVRCDGAEDVWPIGEDRLKRMNPLDRLAEI